MKYDKLEAQTVPEMHKSPLQNMCLNIKKMEFGDIKTFLNRTIEPPKEDAVLAAILQLKACGALDGEEKLTSLGYHLCSLSTGVQIGKMLLYGCMFRCVDSVLTIAAALNCKNPFKFTPETAAVGNFLENSHGCLQSVKSARTSFLWGRSDLLTIVKAYNAWIKVRKEGGKTERDFYTSKHLLKSVLEEISDLKRQFAEQLSDIGIFFIFFYFFFFRIFASWNHSEKTQT